MFGPSVLVGLRGKVALRVGTDFGKFLKTPEGRVFSYSVYFRFKSLVNGLVDMRP